MGKRTMQFRTNEVVSDATVESAIKAFLNPLVSIIHQTVVFGTLRRAERLSNVSNPVPWTVMTGGVSGIMNPTIYPRYISFIGRSRGGRRVRIFVYGTSIAVTDDYRLNFSESSAIEASLAALNSPSSIFMAIDGTRPIWKAYANQGYNAYHQRKRRAVA